QPQLLEPTRLGAEEGLSGEPRQRRAPPERERLVQERSGFVGCRAARIGDEPLEPTEVNLVGFDLEEVPGRPGRDCSRWEQLPQPPPVERAALRCPLRRPPPPERIDDPLTRPDPTRVEGQQRQQRALLGAAEP